MELLFLGTGAMAPTQERNHSGLFIKYKGERILVDCGEGTQRQFKFFKESATKITKILISHWHGDHVLGLPGLLQTLSASEYATKEKPLEMYGPQGFKEQIKQMFSAFPFDCKLDLKIHEVHKGCMLDTADFEIHAYPLDHAIPTIGFRFIEKDKRRINVSVVKKLGIPEGPLLGKLQQNKSIEWKGEKITPKETTYVVEGKKIGIIPDTSQCKNCLEIARETDLLISEATFMGKEKEKAEQYKHLTVEQAALIAHTARTKKLVLMHISPRYKEKSEMEEEAKAIFPHTVLAYDGLKIEI